MGKLRCSLIFNSQLSVTGDFPSLDEFVIKQSMATDGFQPLRFIQSNGCGMVILFDGKVGFELDLKPALDNLIEVRNSGPATVNFSVEKLLWPESSRWLILFRKSLNLSVEFVNNQ